jgi:two-component system LytT family response regulator
MNTLIRTLVVDDDALARQRVRELTKGHPDITIIHESSGGLDAVETIRNTEIDLVFLDIQMPDLDGFGVVAAIGAERMPPVIFTTAYAEYAVRAFEAYALDYLLKPFDLGRLTVALDKARVQIAQRHASNVGADARISGLLQQMQDSPNHLFPEAIAIRNGTQYVVTRVADVDWIEADGNYSRLHVNKRPRLLTKSLATLEKDILDPDVFVRVHRSAIVNSKRITAVEPKPHGDLLLVLQDGTHVDCSRRFRKRLEDKLYFTS